VFAKTLSEKVLLLSEKGEYSSPSLLVLMAALEEEKGIGPTIAELKQYLGDSPILVVDGKSRDQTVNIAKDMGADILFQEGKGKGDAVGCAIKRVGKDVDYVIFTDADYTYPAMFLPGMIRLLEENPEIGMVCGNRFNSRLHIEAMRNTYYFGNRVLAFTHNLLNGVALRDPLTGLRVVRGEIIRSWRPKSNNFDIEVEMNHYVERQGYNIVEVEIPYRARMGQKKLKISHGITILKRILLEKFAELAFFDLRRV
jgi:glycosyltransferase involved in cell wall biosynthesis